MEDNHLDQTASFYDAEANVYDKTRYSSKRGRLVDSFHRGVLNELLLEDRRDSVLELGCGTGRLSVVVGAKVQTLVGVDISENMLRIAQARKDSTGADNISLLKGDGMNLPFSSETFDAVYAILVLNLSPDIGSILREIKRVIKPGGTLVFNLPNLLSIYFLGGLYVNLRKRSVSRNSSGYRFSRWYSRSQVERIIADSGFELVDSRCQPLFPGVVGKVSGNSNTLLARIMSKSVYYSVISR